MSKTRRQHYTADDIESALEDERAKLVIWRSEAIRELRACLYGQDDKRPKRPAGAGVILKTFRRADGKPN
jgi:hypothetical protein